MTEDEPVKKVKKKSGTNWFLTIGISLVLTAIVLVICFLLQGETKVTGGWPDPETSESLSCEAQGVNYPIFKYDNSEKKTTEIKAVFNDDRLGSISLIYQLYYGDKEAIVQSEAENHAAMNLAMQNEGLGPDALGMNFAKLSDKLKMSLYAKGNEVNGATVKYFDLSGVSKYDRATIQAAYEQKGYNCVAKNE